MLFCHNIIRFLESFLNLNPESKLYLSYLYNIKHQIRSPSSELQKYGNSNPFKKRKLVCPFFTKLYLKTGIIPTTKNIPQNQASDDTAHINLVVAGIKRCLGGDGETGKGLSGQLGGRNYGARIGLSCLVYIMCLVDYKSQ